MFAQAELGIFQHHFNPHPQPTASTMALCSKSMFASRTAVRVQVNRNLLQTLWASIECLAS
jgi:hypothetical protein